MVFCSNFSVFSKAFKFQLLSHVFIIFVENKYKKLKLEKNTQIGMALLTAQNNMICT